MSLKEAQNEDVAWMHAQERGLGTMLIRRLEGSIFHIVCGESADERQYICLCGRRVKKEAPEQQVRADGFYSRCLTCQRIEHARFSAHYCWARRSG